MRWQVVHFLSDKPFSYLLFASKVRTNPYICEAKFLKDEQARDEI